MEGILGLASVCGVWEAMVTLRLKDLPKVTKLREMGILVILGQSMFYQHIQG